jgi:hypothetical protein
VYLYDLPSEQWACLSCNPSGPTTREGRFKTNLQVYGGLEAQLYIPNNLSADGSRAFFETEEALVGRDSNGAADVYEWRDGEVNLVSSGREPTGSHFLAASPSGRDVFIATRERLVPEDKDSNVDAYDAREGGGSLHLPHQPECEGDSCQGAAPAAPARSAPASAQLAAIGNRSARRKPSRCQSRKAVKSKRTRPGKTKKRGCAAKPPHAKSKGGRRR